jgi:hypothetical protein
MWIATHFVENNLSALGLSPIVTIINFDTGTTIISGASMVEKGSGFYGYDFTGHDPDANYSIVCDSVTLLGSNRYTYATSGEYGDILEDIQTTISGVDVRTLLLIKIQTNKLELQDGSIGNWILYQDDDITPLLTFNVVDKNNELIIQSAHVPSRRSKAVQCQ